MNLNKLEVYFKMAHSIKELSPDEETKVGAVMLSPSGRIIAASYNGFLRKANDNKLPKTRPEKYKYVQHAERNLLYNCCYEGINTKGTTVLTTVSPCEECVRACYQAGVKRIIFDELYWRNENCRFYMDLVDVNVKVKRIGRFTSLEFRNCPNLFERLF